MVTALKKAKALQANEESEEEDFEDKQAAAAFTARMKIGSEAKQSSEDELNLDEYSAAQAPKVPRTSGKKKTNKRGPRKWVPKNKIVCFADIINRSIGTSRKKGICSKNWNLKLLVLMKLGTTRMSRLVEILAIIHQFKNTCLC